MSRVIQAERIQHYKSMDNLQSAQREESVKKKHRKNTHNESMKSYCSQKKHPQSRMATQINDKIICSRKSSTKYLQMIRQTRPKGKPEGATAKGAKTKSTQGAHKCTESGKKIHGSGRAMSPVTSKFTIKKEMPDWEKPDKKDRKPLKKGRQQGAHFQRSVNRVETIETMFPAQTNTKKCPSKSKEKVNKSVEKRKSRKMHTQMSLESTPSCLWSEEVELLELVGEGTFGRVYQARMRRSGQVIAIKKVVQDSRYKNREMDIIKLIKSEFVVEFLGSFITQQEGREYLNIMMHFYEENLYHRIEEYQQSSLNRLDMKIILYQLFKGLSYLHSLNICHRDIKPENVLLKGSRAVICDFGSAKVLIPNEKNISYICARCYRAPELIFGSTQYSTIVDIWSAGCVVLEMLHGEPLFVGETSVSHLIEVIKVMGTPSEAEVISMNPTYDLKQLRFPHFQKVHWDEMFPKTDPTLLQLIDRVMVYSPERRATAIQVLALAYFDELRDELTFRHISAQYGLRGFFEFSPEELEGRNELRDILIPRWYE